MKEKAIEKIKQEISGQAPYTQVIGEYLVKLIEENPSAAEKILAADKTVKGSFEAMRSEAQKIQKDRCACFTSDEGFAIVRKYFDIADCGAVMAEQPVVAQSEKRVAIDLDSLL